MSDLFIDGTWTSGAAGLNVSGLAPNGGVAMFRVTPVW